MNPPSDSKQSKKLGTSDLTDNSQPSSEQSTESSQKKKSNRRERRKSKREKRLQQRTNFKKELFAIPNILTYIRIIMIPVILLALAKESRYSSFVAALLFAGTSATDFFDGFLARKLNQITTLGKLLDPLADKLVVSAALIVMIPIGRVPSWLVITLLAREFTITGLRGIAASEGMVISASNMGKYKTLFQMVAIFALLIHYPYHVDYFGLFTFYLHFQQVGMMLLYIALFYSIVSAIEYFWKFAQQINTRQKQTK